MDSFKLSVQFLREKREPTCLPRDCIWNTYHLQLWKKAYVLLLGFKKLQKNAFERRKKVIDAVEKRLFSACSTLFMLLVVIKITLNPAPLAQSAWYFYIFFHQSTAVQCNGAPTKRGPARFKTWLEVLISNWIPFWSLVKCSIWELILESRETTLHL